MSPRHIPTFQLHQLSLRTWSMNLLPNYIPDNSVTKITGQFLKGAGVVNLTPWLTLRTRLNCPGVGYFYDLLCLGWSSHSGELNGCPPFHDHSHMWSLYLIKQRKLYRNETEFREVISLHQQRPKNKESIDTFEANKFTLAYYNKINLLNK